MSYIPDTRDPLERGQFSEKKEPNAYYEGLLDNKSLWEMAENYMDDEAYVPRFKQLEEDYNNLSEKDFLNKYKRRSYNEYGDYDEE